MDLIITQLTDMHISSSEDVDCLLLRTSSIVGAIADVIRKPNETLLLICVTGDIAYSGTAEQYKAAEHFFDDIIEKLHKRFGDELWVQYSFIPGNHDCDFSNRFANARQSVITDNNIDMQDPGVIQLCTSVQNNFFDFVNRLETKGLCSNIKNDGILTENVLHNYTNPDFLEWNIKLHCINTAWCSQLHEKKELRFSIPQGIKKREK